MAEKDVLTVLPLDIIFQILSKLPTESLLQLRRVSKSFTPLISHPHFLKLHFSAASAGRRRHLVYYESTDYTKAYFSFHVDNSFALCKILETPFKSVHGYLRIVGSSKGIVCLFDTNYFTCVGTVILWNPFIGKFRIVSCPHELNYFRKNLSHMVLGFGFDCKIVDFKVVKILYDFDNEHDLLPKALVYGLKSGNWRSIGRVVPCFMPRNWSSSVFVNGVVHWLAYKRPSFSGEANCIMGFDLVEEKFEVIELPSDLRPNLNEIRLCRSFDEKSLALFVNYHLNVGEAWEIWLMKDYGKVESWTFNGRVYLEKVHFPLRMVDGGGVLSARSDEKLILIDVEKGEVSDLGVCGLPLSFYADDYIPSLAMLDTGPLSVEDGGWGWNFVCKKLILIDLAKEEVSDHGVCGFPLSFYADDYIPSLAMLDTGEHLPEYGFAQK